MTTLLDEFRPKLDLFTQALQAERFEDACSAARNAVSELKSLLCDSREDSDEVLNSAFYLAVLFRGLYDFAELSRLTQGEWFRNRDLIEKVWDKFCDCQDRVGFVASNIGGRTINFIKGKLQEIDEFYFAHFGQGWYMSPEIRMRRTICSICRSDLRRCVHITGRVYSGRLCYSTPDNIGLELKSGSIVEVPHDRRCRIWPWQIKDDNTANILFMSFFRIDDFMEKSDWK